MLQPSRMKYRKHHRGRMKGKSKRGSNLTFGDYGLMALEPVWLTDRQIEAARIAISRHVKRVGKMWIKVFAETRMGKGKGNVEYWVAVVKPGKVIFEIAGVPEELAQSAFRLAGFKLPIKTKFIKREAI